MTDGNTPGRLQEFLVQFLSGESSARNGNMEVEMDLVNPGKLTFPLSSPYFRKLLDVTITNILLL